MIQKTLLPLVGKQTGRTLSHTVKADLSLRMAKSLFIAPLGNTEKPGCVITLSTVRDAVKPSSQVLTLCSPPVAVIVQGRQLKLQVSVIFYTFLS